MFYAQKNAVLLQVELRGKKVIIALKEPLELQKEFECALPLEVNKAERYLNNHHYINNQGALGRQFRKQGWIVAYQKTL